MANPLIIREEDGVVGDHGIARGEDAWHHTAHHVQDPIVHKQIIDQKLKILKKSTKKSI